MSKTRNTVCILNSHNLGFESELGSWAVLGADSLVKPANAYSPDFTATLIGTESVRLLHISRVEFQQLLYPLVNPRPRVAAAQPPILSPINLSEKAM